MRCRFRQIDQKRCNQPVTDHVRIRLNGGRWTSLTACRTHADLLPSMRIEGGTYLTQHQLERPYCTHPSRLWTDQGCVIATSDLTTGDLVTDGVVELVERLKEMRQRLFGDDL